MSKEKMSLEDLKDLGTQRNDTVMLKVGSHLEEDSLGHRLSIDFAANFKSIFGKTYSIGNVMRFLSYENAKPVWINSQLRKNDYAFIRRSAIKRDIPNFWNILTLVTVDRILSDEDLIRDVIGEYDDQIDAIRIMPMIEVKRGVLTEEIRNDKLKVYGIIAGIHLRTIVNMFIDEFGADVADIDAKDYNAFRLKVKEVVINKIMDNLKSDNLFDGLDGKTTNEDIVKAFLEK